MKSEKALWSSISILIGVVIAVLAFARGNAQIWFLLVVFSLWGTWVVGFLLLPMINQAKKNRKRRAMLKARYQQAHGIPKQNYPNPTEGESATELLMRHVNLRITNYIRSIYQDAIWEWCEKNPADLIINGGTGRIRVYGIEEYNHADIKIDKRGNISCSMVKSVPLNMVNGTDDSEENLSPNQQPVNTQIWYELQARKVLETTIADLNSRGYSKLTIREDGDVLIDQGEDDTPQEHLTSFPAKVYWPQLIKVLQSEGMAAQIVPNGIQLTW